MDDTWLHALHRDPSPEFAERLRRRLQAADRPAAAPAGVSRPLVVAAAGVVLGVALLAVPSVRASAARFLSLFRVVNFVAVPVHPGRLEQLQAQQLDIGRLIGEHVEMVADPGPPRAVGSIDEAAAAAGIDVQLPQWLPDNSTIVETSVTGERIVRVTADAGRLQQVMEALGITDLSVPDGLDGQQVNVRVPPVVMVRYDHGGRRTRVYQAHSPQMTLPAAVDVAALGEIGLRILGLSPADAHEFAAAIDWQTTLLVPVPITASSFRQVTINGHRGIAIEHQPPDQAFTYVVLWSTGDRVFAIVSIQELPQVLAMANSVR
jgi:hypothetical protein